MNKLFDIIEDLVSLEKTEYERTTDFGETLDFQTVFLLHLDSNRFLIVDDELEIIGDGRDNWFCRFNNYCSEPCYFSNEELDSYQKMLRQTK